MVLRYVTVPVSYVIASKPGLLPPQSITIHMRMLRTLITRGCFFGGEKAWKIFARDAWHDLRIMTLIPQRGTDGLSHVYCVLRNGQTGLMIKVKW